MFSTPQIQYYDLADAGVKKQMFKEDEVAERKKRQDALKRANVKLAQMELVTKQEMLKNHFGDRMLPRELQVMKHFRTGSSAKV